MTIIGPECVISPLNSCVTNARRQLDIMDRSLRSTKLRLRKAEVLMMRMWIRLRAEVLTRRGLITSECESYFILFSTMRQCQ